MPTLKYLLIKVNMTILKDSVNNSNTDKIILTLQCNTLHGLPKEIVLQPPSFPPRHSTSSDSTSFNSATSQVQTNAPSAYGRHTDTESIFSFSLSFSKIRSDLIEKYQFCSIYSTMQCLWNGQYHFKNTETVLRSHLSQHTYA